ncbi:hypothetical protein AB0I84_40480, partial [Streptomyces spectabilis]
MMLGLLLARALRMRTAVTGLRTDPGGRVTGVTYVDGRGAPGEPAADLTVACDGRDSRVRRATRSRTAG